MTEPLPIDPVLPELRAALQRAGRAVLVAPPGAGKTTRVPLALMPDIRGRIVMLEPRRLAARAAAQRLAEALGEAPGGAVGFRIRGEAVPGARIEVVTEGILTRMLQSDPSLPGIGAVIFDEFHERSLNADLGLALAWEARGALRPDLGVVVMSATLDAAPVAALLDDAPVIRAEGRAFPVETRWLERPLPGGVRLEAEAARLIARAFDETAEGTILAFLPGEGEIRRVLGLLADLPAEVLPLYGALPYAAQRAALASPAPDAPRRIVLATSIAETSLTIPGVTVVVDAGRARRARFDPASGMSRLVTERASRAEAEQRRGRAGRVAPGVCYRLWAKAEEGAMPGFAPPEIETADLAPLALELAAWGSQAGEGLAFLTPPPAGTLAEARMLLAQLGALDAEGRITGHGQALAKLPLHPRLGHMLARAGCGAAEIAALLSDRDPLRGGGADLAPRLAAIRGGRVAAEADAAALARIRAEARRLARLAPATAPHPGLSPGGMASLAYPDRIGLRRPGEAPRFLLSGGRGAVLDAADPLRDAPLIVALDLDGAGREPRIRLAAALPEAELRALHGGRITREDSVVWSARENRVLARRQERLGALALSDAPLPDPDPEAIAAAALDGLRALGLPWTPAAARLRARIALTGEDTSDAALLADPGWLLPFLHHRRTAADLRGLDLSEPLLARLGWDGRQALDRIAPSHFQTPLGRRIPIDYAAETPSIEVKLPELYGVSAHPTVGGQPLRIALLSPAGRPVQVTTDLPGFWDGSWPEVRKEMRGRYPRHPWPEDPRAAQPTTRAKPRA
ncbi:ATP-dependent helicase HrpB [Paracoccus sp. S-4012]|uniref:ATP-dependent helicase HrpB n=1 Tax=Paracoccus sp. S-4012 TaxID=2665648 RepID=UPI00351B1EBD